MWRDQTVDSLNQLDVPRQLDTALFHKRLNNRVELNTIIDDIATRQFDKGNHYVLFLRHRDSLIANRYEYDRVDGKLLKWSRHFLNGSANVDFIVSYDKNGKVNTFCTEETVDHGQYTVPLPKFTIYKLIDVLKKDGVNLRDVIMYHTSSETLRIFGDVSYPKYNWQVGVFHFDDQRQNSGTIHWREFDSDNGQLVREWNEKWHYD